MTLKEAKAIVKSTTLYGNENMPIGSSGRSYFETELRNFIDGYNRGLEDAATNAEIKWGYGGGLAGDPYVDEESILNLKI